MHKLLQLLHLLLVYSKLNYKGFYLFVKINNDIFFNELLALSVKDVIITNQK
jgi:hypothetical protein